MGGCAARTGGHSPCPRVEGWHPRHVLLGVWGAAFWACCGILGVWRFGCAVFGAGLEWGPHVLVLVLSVLLFVWLGYVEFGQLELVSTSLALAFNSAPRGTALPGGRIRLRGHWTRGFTGLADVGPSLHVGIGSHDMRGCWSREICASRVSGFCSHGLVSLASSRDLGTRGVVGSAGVFRLIRGLGMQAVCSHGMAVLDAWAVWISAFWIWGRIGAVKVWLFGLSGDVAGGYLEGAAHSTSCASRS